MKTEIVPISDLLLQNFGLWSEWHKFTQIVSQPLQIVDAAIPEATLALVCGWY
jgi:hypothetical protein